MYDICMPMVEYKKKIGVRLPQWLIDEVLVGVGNKSTIIEEALIKLWASEKERFKKLKESALRNPPRFSGWNVAKYRILNYYGCEEEEKAYGCTRHSFVTESENLSQCSPLIESTDLAGSNPAAPITATRVIFGPQHVVGRDVPRSSCGSISQGVTV